MERRSPLATLLTYGAALVLAAFTLAPLLWLVVMSLSSTADLTAKPLRWWPQTVDLSRYRTLLTIATNSAGEAFLAAQANHTTHTTGTGEGR